MGELLVEKVAIVTGGASGLGRATVELFAQHGAKVVIADVNDERGAETVKAVEAQGGEATYLHTDVAVSADVRAVTPEQRAAIPHSQPRQRFGEAIFPVCEPTEVAQVHLFLN